MIAAAARARSPWATSRLRNCEGRKSPPIDVVSPAGRAPATGHVTAGDRPGQALRGPGAAAALPVVPPGPILIPAVIRAAGGPMEDDTSGIRGIVVPGRFACEA